MAGGIYPPAPTLAWVEQETESSGGIKKRRTPSLHVGEGTLPGKISRPGPAGWHYVPHVHFLGRQPTQRGGLTPCHTL